MVASPPLDLAGHCSAFFNNTLFVYSPAGFQSLSLSKEAQWKVLEPGVSVDGGICVQATVSGNDAASALWIVGGRANSSQPDYLGLQRFVYSSGQWETITPVVPVTQNRQNHGAAYLNQSSSIAVYAGSQEPGNSLPSSQTFVISTAPPYNVLSYNSQAPPGVSPMIMPYNESHAVMIGGSTDNKQVFVFDQSGWSDLGAQLVEPITDSKTVRCTVVTGSDGSKVLEEYNLGVSPNTVVRYALWSNGMPAPPGTMVGAGTAAASSRRRKRQSIQSWPPYNSSLAPTATRSQYAVAQAPNGYAIITGGNAAEPIAIFNQRSNGWVDPSSVFGNAVQAPLGGTSSTRGTSSTATASPSSSAAAAASSGKPKVLDVLGGTLGGVLGFALLLVIVLLLLKKASNKRKAKREQLEKKVEKEDRLSFADQGAEFMHEAGGSVGRGYAASLHGSVGSLQIFPKKTAGSGHRRGMPSDASTSGLVKNKSPLGFNDPMEMSHLHDRSPPTTAGGYSVGGGTLTSNLDPADQPRSPGWSQYFANNNVTDLQTMQQGPHYQSQRSSDISRSDYDDSRQNSSIRPLELNLGPKFESERLEDEARTGRAVSTSSYGDFNLPIHFSGMDQIRDSNVSNMTTFPRGVSSSSSALGTWGNAFAKSPTIHPPRSAPAPLSSDFPMPRAYAGSQVRDSTASNMTAFPQGIPSPTMPAFPRQPRFADSRNQGPANRGPVIRKMTGSEDMSWLNINADK
jgi:hypothetical protein